MKKLLFNTGIIIALGGLIITGIHSQESPTIYVKALAAGIGATKPTADKISGEIEREIVKSGKYQVMSQDQVKQLMDNAGMQMSLGCNSEECMRQIMKTTQTDYILYGDVKKEGKEFIVTVNLMHRKTGGNAVVEKTARQYTEDVTLRVLEKIARNLVDELHGEMVAIDEPKKEESKSYYYPGKTKTVGGIEFVYINSGEFMMGSPEGKGRTEERPLHKVKLNPFWIGRYEVTQSQYESIMGVNPSYFKGGSLPVESMKLFDVKNYCHQFSEKYKVIARLPFEAEWEYACRAGTTSNYYWGDSMDGNYCWYNGNAGNKTHPVGQKLPNAWGLYDMSGNVWEWCEDWYDNSYYSVSPDMDPHGPQKGGYRVIRGGSWTGNSVVDFLRSAFRGGGLADYVNGYKEINYDYTGFRVVLEAN